MKLVKLSVFALAFGLFATSCGGNKEEAKTNDSAAMATAAEATPATTAPVADTAAKAADTAKKMDAAAPAKTEVKTETKKK